MTLEHRLDRLVPGLSARERALLSIRATLDDQREDPAIRSTMPRDQIADFNHFIGIANGVLHVLLPHALVLGGEVEALRLRYALLLVLQIASQDDIAERLMALTDRARNDLTACWARLLAQEQVAAEIEHEFGDPVALPVQWRDIMTETRIRLEELHADSAPQLGSLELPGADETVMSRLRQGIRNQKEP